MFDFTIKGESGNLLKGFPETIKTATGNTAKIESPRVILAEYAGNPSVGVSAVARVRHFKPSSDSLSASVTEESQMFGEIAYVPCDSTFKDIVKAVENLVDKILEAIVAWG